MKLSELLSSLQEGDKVTVYLRVVVTRGAHAEMLFVEDDMEVYSKCTDDDYKVTNLTVVKDPVTGAVKLNVEYDDKKA